MSEKDLATLCATIEPEMAEPIYVYCSFPDFALPKGSGGPEHSSHVVNLNRSAPASTDEAGSCVVVRLPHLTRTLSLLFEAMWEHWAQWDPERPPKSSTVARAIDAKLGLKGQADGEASRNAQSFAAALRPDSLSDADGRHR